MATDPAQQRRVLALAKRLDGLGREALLANPLLDFPRLLLVKRAYRLGSGKTAGGAARRPNDPQLPRASRSVCRSITTAFSASRSGYQNEIDVLSPVRRGGKLSTLFRPAADVFVGEVDLDFDGRRMLLTMPEDDRWQVFELGSDGTGPVRVTPNEERDVDNYDACYLPDGRIVFASTASYQSVPCWNGLHNVGSLYLLDRRSGKIRQLTFDQDDDNYPSVLNDGRVLFYALGIRQYPALLRPLVVLDESRRQRPAALLRRQLLLAECDVFRGPCRAIPRRW